LKKEDNFGDHKQTGQPRFDGDMRAPLDMGRGSRKVHYIECPGNECNAHISCKSSTVRVTCGTCGTSFDPHEQVKVKGGEVYDHPKLSSFFKFSLSFPSSSEY